MRAPIQLDKITNLAVIVAALVFVGTTLVDRLSPAKAPMRPPSPDLIGRKLELSPAVTPTHGRAITLFVSRTCDFCTESMGFYRRLADSRPQSCRTKIFVVEP